MWPYLLALATLIVVPTMTTVIVQLDEQQTTNEVMATSSNMQVYRTYVTKYAAANSAVTGTVADALLGLPTWYNKMNGVTNYVTNGRGYVYVLYSTNDLAYQLLQDMNYTINVGIKTNGILQNPLNPANTTTPLPLPAAIPDGSVVIAS